MSSRESQSNDQPGNVGGSGEVTQPRGNNIKWIAITVILVVLAIGLMLL